MILNYHFIILLIFNRLEFFKGLAGISSYIGPKRRLQLSQTEIINILKNPTIPITDLDQATSDKLESFGKILFYHF